jgi:hypothetical protein
LWVDGIAVFVEVDFDPFFTELFDVQVLSAEAARHVDGSAYVLADVE